ncbi:hypothetical protein HpHA181_15220 [Helicobacter pylori]
MPTKDLSKLIEKLNHEKKNAIKNGIYHLIQIKFSYNSNRIEGSSLTYEQTAHIFDKSALITEKNENIRLDDIFETINHFECVNYLLESYREPLSLEYLKTLHKILKNNCSDEVIGGFKKHPNFVGDSVTTRPQLVEKELTNLLQRYLTQRQACKEIQAQERKEGRKNLTSMTTVNQTFQALINANALTKKGSIYILNPKIANAFGSDRKNRAILLEFEDAKMREHLRQQAVEKKAEKLSNFIKEDLKD